MVSSGVHAAPVSVDSTSVTRQSSVESHANSNGSRVKSLSETTVSSDLVHSGDPESEGVPLVPVVTSSIPGSEGIIPEGSEMVP